MSPTHTPQYCDPQAYPAGIAWQDGQYIPVSQAKISDLDDRADGRARRYRGEADGQSHRPPGGMICKTLWI